MLKKGSLLVLCEKLLSTGIQLQFGLCSYLFLFFSCERCPVLSFRVVYFMEHNPVITIQSKSFCSGQKLKVFATRNHRKGIVDNVSSKFFEYVDPVESKFLNWRWQSSLIRKMNLRIVTSSAIASLPLMLMPTSVKHARVHAQATMC
uniref:Uncharacterized protein n=1 Tax=Physcomitrium patens TaxID=3218 RepID=A0A2K1IQY0_PHYPA|nr:hypothetical protein PHYPA_025788 [Physcomitrium patens]